MVRKDFYITPEHDTFLTEVSRDGKSVSEHLRLAIDDYKVKKQAEKKSTTSSSTLKEGSRNG